MKLKYLYAMYDNGKIQGERPSKEWAEALHVSVHLVRDYTREGRAYKGRYTFKAVQEDESEEKVLQEDPKITAQDLAEFKRSLKIGDRFDYESHRKDFVKGSRTVSEKVAVVRKFPHIVKLASVDNPDREVTMTYGELLRQKKARAKKRMLKAGR